MTTRAPGDILDRECGKVRVLSERCDTCVFWPGNLMHLTEGRLEEIIAANIAAGALLTCHGTLPYGRHPDFGPAACAGFWAKHRFDVAAGRMAMLLLGVVRIRPPKETARH